MEIRRYVANSKFKNKIDEHGTLSLAISSIIEKEGSFDYHWSFNEILNKDKRVYGGTVIINGDTFNILIKGYGVIGNVFADVEMSYNERDVSRKSLGSMRRILDSSGLKEKLN